MSYSIKFYQNSNGRFPVQEFIHKLDKRTKGKVSDAIKILSESGPYLKPPYMKKLVPNLYELRIKSQIAIRIFYSPKTNRYYLLHAFIKKSDKTPLRELHIAIDRMKELI